MRNSNFLLPWDVSLVNNNNARNGSERGRFSKSARGRYRGGRTGNEYYHYHYYCYITYSTTTLYNLDAILQLWVHHISCKILDI